MAHGAPAQVSQFGTQLLHGEQQAQAVLDENAAAGGKPQAACMPFKKRVAQRILKFTNSPACRSQRQVRALGRRREAAGLGAVHR